MFPPPAYDDLFAGRTREELALNRPLALTRDVPVRRDLTGSKAAAFDYTGGERPTRPPIEFVFRCHMCMYIQVGATRNHMHRILP